MTVVAKFKVCGIETSERPKTNWDPGTPRYTVRLEPVSDGSVENKQFFRWTPGGSILFQTADRALADQFRPWGDFYVYFDRADAPAQAPAFSFVVEKLSNSTNGSEKLYTVDLRASGRAEGDLRDFTATISLGTINEAAAREFLGLGIVNVRLERAPAAPANGG